MGDIKSYIQESVIRERDTSKEVSSIVSDIVSEIVDRIIDGVVPVSKNISIVKLSNLQHNIWSPEYYMPAIQADYVHQNLKTVCTFTSLYNKLCQMIRERAVKIGCNYYRLNDTTVEILSEYA